MPAGTGVLTAVRKIVRRAARTRAVYWIIDGASRERVRVLARDGRARILRVSDQPRGWRVRTMGGHRSLVVVAPSGERGTIEVVIGRGAGLTRVFVHVTAR